VPHRAPLAASAPRPGANPPPDPHQNELSKSLPIPPRARRPCLCCLWTNRPYAWTYGQPCRLTTCPHYGASLPTGVCLRPCALRLPIFLNQRIQGMDLSPLTAGWWGVEEWGKLRPTVQKHSMGAFPYVPDGAGASFRGPRGQQNHTAAAFTGLPLPIPRSRH
jgi:hypothetical protein